MRMEYFSEASRLLPKRSHSTVSKRGCSLLIYSSNFHKVFSNASQRPYLHGKAGARYGIISFPHLAYISIYKTHCADLSPSSYFSPIAHGPTRLLGIVGFISLHVGFAFTLRLGTFFWVSGAMKRFFFLSFFHTLLICCSSGHPECTVAVLVLGRVSTSNVLIGSTLKPCKGRSSHQHSDSCRKDRAAHLHFRSCATTCTQEEASQSIATSLEGVLLTSHYMNNRLFFSLQVLASFYIASLVVAAIGFNTATLEDHPETRWTDHLLPAALSLGIDQNWALFAPYPPDTDYWLAIRGISPTAREFEIFRNGGLFTWHESALSWEQPARFSTGFYNHRWVKYWESYVEPDYSSLKPFFHRWLCREWNLRHQSDDSRYY